MTIEVINNEVLISVSGGTGAVDYSNILANIKSWVASQNWIAASITRNSSGVVTSAIVTYPDGKTGTFTATSFDNATGAINSWVATYDNPVQYTFTQSAVTRDLSGAVTVQPAITVS
jgi:hypothetical protein